MTNKEIYEEIDRLKKDKNLIHTIRNASVYTGDKMINQCVISFYYYNSSVLYKNFGLYGSTIHFKK